MRPVRPPTARNGIAPAGLAPDGAGPELPAAEPELEAVEVLAPVPELVAPELAAAELDGPEADADAAPEAADAADEAPDQAAEAAPDRGPVRGPMPVALDRRAEPAPARPSRPAPAAAFAPSGVIRPAVAPSTGPSSGGPEPEGFGGAGERGTTAPQLRRFIKSRAYVPMHELRRRFAINGGEDDVTPVDLERSRVYVGLPEREGRLLGELLRAGDIGYELSMDPISPIVVGVYPMRPVSRG